MVLDARRVGESQWACADEDHWAISGGDEAPCSSESARLSSIAVPFCIRDGAVPARLALP